MRVRRLSSNRINTIPHNIIEKILSLLPIRDAVRTSILSKKWRYYWMSIPEVVFEDTLFEVPSILDNYKKYMFFNAVFHVLMLRRGSLLHFGLVLYELETHSEIDKIILYLSTSNTLKSFSLETVLSYRRYKLPSLFFSFTRLETLALTFCECEPPLTFNGFSMLRSLNLRDVVITNSMLQRLLINSPLLEKIELHKVLNEEPEGKNEFTFAKLFECSPSLVHIVTCLCYTEDLLAGGMPLKLSTLPVYLKIIDLEVYGMREYVLTFLLCLIKNSPNLEKIRIRTYRSYALLDEKPYVNLHELQDYSCCNFNHFEYLEINGFLKSPPEMEFVKLVMAKSPVLTT